MKILNLTQHQATQDQIENGVVDLDINTKEWLTSMLTFDTLPTTEDIEYRASAIARNARMLGYNKAMVGGALWLMSSLEKHLKINNIQPMYAFSVRESIEVVNDDGSVTKKNVFKHTGFVEV